jgi:flagellar biosynthesis GTPase FlhF
MSDTKRLTQRRRTKSGEAAPPPPPSPSDNNKNSPKNKKYNLRSNHQKSKKKENDNVRWVDDDTLFDDYKSEDDSTYKGEDQTDESDGDNVKMVDATKPATVTKEATREIHGITLPTNMPVSVKIHLHARIDEDEDEGEDEEDYEDEDEDDEDDGFDEDSEEIPSSFIQHILGRRLMSGGAGRQPILIIQGDEDEDSDKKRKKNKEEDDIPLKLSRKEREYFEDLTKKMRKDVSKKMMTISKMINESDVPYKFRVLEMDTTPKIQSEIIRKIDAITRMGSDSGEAQKLRNWVDGILRVPFGKHISLPVTMKDGVDKCSTFLNEAHAKMEKATYGMTSAKTQIMQVLAQWISNPESVGNVIAMRGSAGVGKTSFARNGIAGVLQRPFMFFSLGGASDVSHYVGHSYTYEGSMWGRIIDSIIQSGCMNPVLYFDELDKVSGTPHGEEITSMLIHLTDRSQNSQYHDRYFAGIDFDLSQCLFVFSFNDESRVHPVLKDRMRVINVPGYNDKEKKVIVANYIWPDILKHAGISREDLSADEEAAEYIIKEYSNGEEGMRNLIRVVEAVVSRVNLIRISDEAAAKAYKFYIPVKFPMKLEKKQVETLLTDFNTTLPEHWRSLYT